MKTCSMCNNLQPFENFNKDKYKIDGLTSSCKSCLKLKWDRYKENNIEKLRQKQSESRKRKRKENPEEVRKKARELYKKNKEKRKQYDKNYRVKHADRIRQRRKEYRELNKSKLSIANKLWRLKNSDRIKSKIKQNSGYHAALAAVRRANKIQATPSWLSDSEKQEIKLLYLFVAERRKQTGLDLEVDHIVPLKGKTVCGLHVPWNLQVITASENASKGNRF